MRRPVFSAVFLFTFLMVGFAQEVHKVDSLSPNDEKYQNKTPIHWYAVSLNAGNRLAIRVVSVDFQPAIVVSTGYGADHTIQGSGGSASYSYSSETDTSVKIGVTSGSTSALTGSFMIRIAQVPLQTAIRLQERISSELVYDDEILENQRNVKWFTLAVKKGQRLSVAVWSNEFNPSLIVSLPGNISTRSEEPTSGKAAARFMSPADGEARIGVTSESEGKNGSFTIQALSSKDARPVTVGSSVSGSLNDGDDMLAGKPMDAYRLHGKANTRVVAQLSSATVDTVLYVDDGRGRAENSDDAYDSGTDSELFYTFVAEGDIELRVYAVDESERGDYKLTIREVPPPPSLKDGDSIDGSLSNGDEILEGRFADRYLFTGTAGQSVRLDLASEDFDAYLLVTGVNGESLESDDVSEDSTDSRLSYAFPKDGTIQIIVTSLDEEESGGYTLYLDAQKKR
jgi:hypothetical protein